MVTFLTTNPRVAHSFIEFIEENVFDTLDKAIKPCVALFEHSSLSKRLGTVWDAEYQRLIRIQAVWHSDNSFTKNGAVWQAVYGRKYTGCLYRLVPEGHKCLCIAKTLMTFWYLTLDFTCETRAWQWRGYFCFSVKTSAWMWNSVTSRNEMYEICQGFSHTSEYVVTPKSAFYA